MSLAEESTDMPIDKKNAPGAKSYYMRLPPELHQALVKRAKDNRRSLAQEIVFMLENGIKNTSR